MELMDAYMKQGKHIVFLIDEAQKHTDEMRVIGEECSRRRTSFPFIAKDLFPQESSNQPVMVC